MTNFNSSELGENIRVFKRPEVNVVKPHIHECVELVYISEGTGSLYIQERSIEVSRGDFCE